MSDTCDESFEAMEKLLDQWKLKAREHSSLLAIVGAQNDLLRRLNAKGGLGIEVHEEIRRVLMTTGITELEALRRFARDCRDNYDCDTGANGVHPSSCRACNARELLSQSNTAAITLAKTI